MQFWLGCGSLLFCQITGVDLIKYIRIIFTIIDFIICEDFFSRSPLPFSRIFLLNVKKKKKKTKKARGYNDDRN